MTKIFPHLSGERGRERWEFGYGRIYDAAYAPNFFNFNPLANINGSTSMAGNLPSCPL